MLSSSSSSAMKLLSLVTVTGLHAASIQSEVEPPPSHEEYALYSRYLVHEANWTVMATIAAREPIVSSPFANVFSISDGQPGVWSSGVPYIYSMPLELSFIDLLEDSRASISVSLAQTGYCAEQGWDWQWPQCGHVILTGNIVMLEEGSDEEAMAREALFTRHPSMADWPGNHGWFFCKLDIQNIQLLNYFGGAITVPVADYYAAQLY